MTTLTSPLDQRVLQPHFQALGDSLKGELHSLGDQTCVVSFRQDHLLGPIRRL